MRKLLAGALALVFIAALCGYGFWTQQRPEGHYLSDLRIELALNAGAALYVAGVADSIADGLARARAVLADGSARSRMEQYVAATRRIRGAV